MHARTSWKIAATLCAIGVAGAAADRALAGPGNDFSGTYLASLAERAEIMNLHRDGTATITLSDQVTSGAGGFTFSDSFGSWKQIGSRKLAARFVNLNFDISGTPTFTGTAVVDYVLEFAPGLDTFAGSCQGKIYPTGQDPFAPGAVPDVEFDCAYLTGNPYRRVPLP
ncbi:MAG: hypothetical protein QM820_41015 [Minicystis sp.]